MNLPNHVWQFKGEKEGPHFVLIGGTHGNELTGIEMIEYARNRLTEKPDLLIAGTVTLILGNPKAVEIGERGSAPHHDFNRVWTQEGFESGTTYEHDRARELAPIVESADYMIDLHATNKPSEPFFVSTHWSQEQELLASAFGNHRYLLVPNSVIAGSIDEYAAKHGATQLSFESGWVEDKTLLPKMRTGLEKIFIHLGMMEGEDELIQPKFEKIKLSTAINLDQRAFRFEEGRGQKSWDPVKAGDVVGYFDNEPIVVEKDGYIMFPKVKEHWKEGSPVFFLAEFTE